MREILTHRNGSALNEALTLLACDDVNDGGAPCEYLVRYARPNIYVPASRILYNHGLRFHTGDPAQGVTGLSNEALLAMVLDRLRGFQTGPYPCPENTHAVQCVEQALRWLRLRSEHRRAREEEPHV
jgi:hypothetical protein